MQSSSSKMSSSDFISTDSKDGSTDLEMDDHQISVDELCRRFDTDLRFGLKRQRVEANLARDGKNMVTPLKPKAKWIGFLQSTRIFRVFLLFLWLASGIYVALFICQLYMNYDETEFEELVLAVLLVAAIVVIGIFSFIQKKPGRKQVLMTYPAQETEVIRDGVRTTISSEDLIIGDLVLLRFGERIPADVRIIESQNFKVNTYSISGDSEPQLKNEKLREANILESPNIAFFSTVAVEGSARAVVIRTGNRTLMGHILGLSAEAWKIEHPITDEIIYYMNILTIWATIVGLVMFLGVWLNSKEFWGDCITIFTGIGIAIIPEGLLITTCISTMLIAQQMGYKNCQVKSLSAVEKLGCISTICLDKGAAVTQKKIYITHLWYDMKTVEISRGIKIEWKEKSSPGFLALSRCALLCNRIDYKESQDDIIEPTKGTTEFEVAIFKFLISCMGKKITQIRIANPIVCKIPYNGIDKFQLTIHKKGENGNKYFMIIMGEPEKLLASCTTIFVNGEDLPLHYNIQVSIDKACVEMAQNGETIVAICELDLPKETYPIDYQFDPGERNFPLSNFRFIGLISLYDPPRPTTPHAISKCRTAGIRVIMITSDHPITAKSIARQIGLISESSRTVEDIAEERKCRLLDVHPTDATAIVIDGTQLKKLSLKELEILMANYREIIFARTSPLQTFMVVLSAQKSGSVVAVAGSGMNDLIALKKADLGVALGISGSDLTKEMADTVLLDDSLSTLVTAIEEGRLLFDNIKKATAFTITATVPELIPFVAHVILGIPLSFGIITILAIDLITNIWPAISLIYEKEEYNLMKRPPNPIDGTLITNQMVFTAPAQIGMLETFAGFFTYFAIMIEHGWLPIRLLQIREKWNSRYVNDLEDSYGQEWTYEGRKSLEFTCQSCFCITIIIVQWGNVIISKTMIKTIIQTSSNWVMNCGLVFETVVILGFLFIPSEPGLHLKYGRPLWLIGPLGYFILIIAYGELRKAVLRVCKHQWFFRESCY